MQFMGTHRNRLDRKGRVSVPAPFRSALARLETPEIVLRPSHRSGSLEAWPASVFQTLAGRLDSLDLFSEAHDDLATALYADAVPLTPDAEGRIVLPEELIAHAGLTEAVAFVGKGRVFELWEPAAFDSRKAEALARAQSQRLALPAGAGGSAGGVGAGGIGSTGALPR